MNSTGFNLTSIYFLNEFYEDLPTKDSDAIEFLHGCPRFIFVFAVKENLNRVGWKQYAYNPTLRSVMQFLNVISFRISYDRELGAKSLRFFSAALRVPLATAIPFECLEK